MDRYEVTLATLAASNGAVHTPVQIQKLLFLLDNKIPEKINGPHFNFVPHNYGPFDRTIYDVLRILEDQGQVEIIRDPSLQWSRYRTTPEGQEEGEEILGRLDAVFSEYIKELSEFVRGLSFSQLVSYIYKEYPEMQVNSVFR